MKTAAALGILLAALLGPMASPGVPAAVAQAGTSPAPPPPSPHPGPPAAGSAAKPDAPGELDCKNCHLAKHQAVPRMYLGTGGRGSQSIPS
ncbi:MAG TPA: hypothetical protein VLD61_03385, partial [Methylomirabilota bacterium]|nr:hypothetical protein [Methylomirabilota bacterium]